MSDDMNRGAERMEPPDPSQPGVGGHVPAEHTLLATTDAWVWAEEFCRIFRGYTIINEDYAAEGGGVPERHVGEGTMIGWFANAIETGRDAGSSPRP